MSDNSPTDTETQEMALDPVEDQAESPEGAQEASRMIRKKQVYDHVTVATGLRKRDVREAVDATLAYLAQSLAEGRDCQLPPLGKIRAIEKGKGAKARLVYKLNLQEPKQDEPDDGKDT